MAKSQWDRYILPMLVQVAHDCGYTRNLSAILEEKLDDREKEILYRWLQMAEQDKRQAEQNAKRDARGF